MSSANLKETPKKVYKSCSAPSNTCRLCRSVCESKYLKNLYNKANCQLLTMAETIYGCKLPCDDELPRLICRPCERRLNNFKAFKTVVCDSQTAFSRTKRCIVISPSAETTAPKSSRRIPTSPAQNPRRRGLLFDPPLLSTENLAPPQVNRR